MVRVELNCWIDFVGISLIHLLYFSSTETDDSCSLPNEYHSGSCCSAENPCDIDEGDCDDKTDCINGLYCGSCPNGFPSSHDCCTGKYTWL